MKDGIFFISDVHLGGQKPDIEQQKEARLCVWIRGLRGRAQRLYIVGDLFDFWFEYRTVIPCRGAKVLFALYDLISSGTDVYCVGGNHDFWLGSYLSDEVGIVLVQGPMEVKHQGVHLYIAHGDGLWEKDVGYQILQRVLRSPLSIALFRLLHPDLGAWIAQVVSRTSRNQMSESKFLRLKESYRAFADTKLEAGFDAIILGHLHVPLLERRTSGILVILGDWTRHCTYAKLENGALSLHPSGSRLPGRQGRLSKIHQTTFPPDPPSTETADLPEGPVPFRS